MSVRSNEEYEIWKRKNPDLYLANWFVKTSAINRSQIKSILDWHIYKTFMTLWVVNNLDSAQYLNFISNKAYFGYGHYGIQEVSKIYFDKNPESLSDEEIIYLLPLLSNPQVYNPVDRSENHKKAVNRIVKRIEKAGVDISISE